MWSHNTEIAKYQKAKSGYANLLYFGDAMNSSEMSVAVQPLRALEHQRQGGSAATLSKVVEGRPQEILVARNHSSFSSDSIEAGVCPRSVASFEGTLPLTCGLYLREIACDVRNGQDQPRSGSCNSSAVHSCRGDAQAGDRAAVQMMVVCRERRHHQN